MTTGSGLYLSPNETDPVKVNTAVRQLIEGRSNAVGTFTLSANVTTTNVTAISCSVTSVVIPHPQSVAAAADIPLMSITPGTGRFTVSHASNSNTARSFAYLVQG